MSVALTVSGKSFAIRPICKEDIDKNYYDLLSQLSEISIHNPTKEDAKRFLDSLHSKHNVYIIQDINTSAIVGTGTILIEDKIIHNYGKVGHIEDIVIDYKYRQLGLGKILIEYLTDYCIHTMQCYKCILNCNFNNVQFYRKCGYNNSQVQMRFNKQNY